MAVEDKCGVSEQLINKMDTILRSSIGRTDPRQIRDEVERQLGGRCYVQPYTPQLELHSEFLLWRFSCAEEHGFYFWLPNARIGFGRSANDRVHQ